MLQKTFRTQFVHFDSISASYIKDINNSSSSTQNAYKSIYPMNQTFTNIKRVYLTSMEIPASFLNIRKGSTDTLRFIVNGTTYSVTLVETNYTLIAALLADLNSAFINVVSGVTIWIGQSGSSRLSISFTGATTVTSFSVIDTNLSKYVLGFRAGVDTYNGTTKTYLATSADWCLTYDSYLLMYIPNLNGMNASMAGQTSTFKVPLVSSNSNQVYYFFEGNTFQQWVDITDPKLTISNLQVNIVDRFGSNLNPSGHDFSFTLALELYD